MNPKFYLAVFILMQSKTNKQTKPGVEVLVFSRGVFDMLILAVINCHPPADI